MDRRRLAVLAALPLSAALGCFTDQNGMLVPTNPFGGNSSVPRTVVANAPATQEAERRVLGVGQKLLQANQPLALRPAFMTIGSPTPEVFHAGTTQVVITEGLVRRCETDEQLAAVLAVELGKMASDREAQAGLQTRNPDREPPPSPGVGADGGGSRGGADLTQLAERAPYEAARKRMIHPPPPPEPKAVAKMILQRAGYTEADLTAAEPLLKTAAENAALEKQMTSPGPSRPWTK